MPAVLRRSLERVRQRHATGRATQRTNASTAVGLRVVRWKCQGVITKPTRPEKRSRAQLVVVMPLAAMVPLGIITVALGLAGLGMGGVHYAFTGEVRDRFNSPSPFCPDSRATMRHSTHCVHWRWRPPSRPPPLVRRLATAAPAAALPYPLSELSARVCTRPPIRLPSDARRR